MNFHALIWKEPWLTPVVLNIRQVFKTTRIPSVGVSPDGKTLYYNPVFWKKLSAEEQIAVQIHEMLHIVYQHTERRKNREQARWNLACDMAINEQIRMAEYQLPEGAIEGENDTAENIYERIKTISFLTEGKSQKDAYIKAICADIEKNAEENVMAGDLLPYNADGTQCGPENEILNAIELSKQMAGAGTTTLSKLFSLQKGRADWKSILRHLVQSVVGADMDYLTYEFDEFGVCEDVLLRKPSAKICALVDESGSIDDHLYEEFCGELRSLSFLAEVYASGFTYRTELKPVPVKKYCRTMSGGTDVRPAYEQACKKDYDCIIVLTDGYLEFPSQEPIATIWVMPESKRKKMEVLV